MSEGADLYERDFVAWTEQQAVRIRAASHVSSNLPIDWDNVAGEIESLGRSLARELGGRLTTIIEHLLKLQHSPAYDPRSGWVETVIRARIDVGELLEENPSLRARLGELVQRANRSASKIVRLDLERRGEITGRPVAPSEFTTDDVLGDWLPEFGKENSPPPQPTLDLTRPRT